MKKTLEEALLEGAIRALRSSSDKLKIRASKSCTSITTKNGDDVLISSPESVVLTRSAQNVSAVADSLTLADVADPPVKEASNLST